MKVVVTGATGNVGTSLIEDLSEDSRVEQIVGLARRLPEVSFPKTSWRAADVTITDLEEVFAGADCVVHLAWLIQPARDLELTDRVNIKGTRRVLEAAANASVPALVVASSVGAYSPGPKDLPVDESWETDGIESCYYSRQKVAVERLLDTFEKEHPETRVVRMRPSIILKPDAAKEIRRLFVGPFLPRALVNPKLIPLVPKTERLTLQILHSEDAGEAYRRAVTSDVRGAFNLAGSPVVDTRFLQKMLGARAVPVGARVLRAAASISWHLRLQPTHPSWLDMGLGSPLLDSSRAKDELGWEPKHTAEETFSEFVAALRHNEDFETPPLSDGPSPGD